MVKGQVLKVETLQDGSIKLSIYVNKEDIHLAFPLTFHTVTVKVSEGEEKDKDGAIALACQAIDKIKDMLMGELVQQTPVDIPFTHQPEGVEDDSPF